MQRVHFIAIGGSAMHNLAIALSKKNNFQITGSDDEIFEPSYSRLKSNGLLPDKLGWFPERIQKGLLALIVGTKVTDSNPELIRAKELGLNIFSFPEYLFMQTRSKTRIVVCGIHGKTTITAMILFVLRKLKMDADYLIGEQIEGFENRIKLTYDARIAVIEGDTIDASHFDKKPRFEFYKPHIGIMTGIDHKNPKDENHQIEICKKFVDLMEAQGRFVYFDGDESLNSIISGLRRDIVPFPYNTPEFIEKEGTTFLISRKTEIPLKISGEQNLQYLNAARLACRQIGIYDEQFYSVISDFELAIIK
jgi:UDP-N-acetylmuramate: L-alanyl-gamma-D-glutamyl-meso-diaminopimelate ligase